MKLENGNEITTITTGTNIRGKRALLNPYDDAKSDIKSCPFCGSESHLQIENGWTCYVQCNECESEGAYFEDTEEGRIQAINAWNHRV